MLKWLIGIAGLVLIATVILVGRQDQIYNTEGKGYEIKCEESSSPPVASGTLVCTAEHSQKTKSSQNDSEWWHIFVAWPEGITVWVVLATGFVIGWQAVLMRRHAEHFESLAKATVRHTEVLANIERPLVLMTSARIPGGPICAITAKNYGRTPAKIIKFSPEKWEATQTGQAFRTKTKPDHGKILAFDDPIVVLPHDGGSYILNVSEDTIRQKCESEAVYESVKSGGMELYIYGTIFYRDLLDTSPESVHETAWCCRYISYAGEGSNFLSMIGGLPGYSYQT